MLLLTHHINPTEWEKLRAAETATLDEARLRYYYLWGSIGLLCTQTGERIPFEAPVLDLALSLMHISDTPPADHTTRYEATDSGAGLSLRREGARVSVSADYADWSCEGTWEAFLADIHGLLGSVLDESCLEAPGLLQNPTVQQAQAAYRRMEGETG
jgi:hypothetical protein